MYKMSDSLFNFGTLPCPIIMPPTGLPQKEIDEALKYKWLIARQMRRLKVSFVFFSALELLPPWHP